MRRLDARLATVLSLVLLVPVLTGCSEETPAVCADVETLQTSMEDLRSTDIGQDGLDAVSEQVSTMRDQVDTLAADASDEYATEVDAVRQQLSRLQTDAQAARSGPTAATLAAVGEDIRSVGRSLEDLVGAVDATC